MILPLHPDLDEYTAQSLLNLVITAATPYKEAMESVLNFDGYRAFWKAHLPFGHASALTVRSFLRPKRRTTDFQQLY